MDRGFLDFTRLYSLEQLKANFVIRSRKNVKFRRLYSRPVDKSKGLVCDQTIKLTGVHTPKYYPKKLRRIRFRDRENNNNLIFLTNNFDLPAYTVAQLYRCRWQIELFFKWIKQHLRIKNFYGRSINAVKTQVWIAISVYVLVAIIKKRLNLELSLYTFLQILSVTAFEKVSILQVLREFYDTEYPMDSSKQLELFKL